MAFTKQHIFHSLGRHFTHSDLGAVELVDASHVLPKRRAMAHLVVPFHRHKQVGMDHLVLQRQQQGASFNTSLIAHTLFSTIYFMPFFYGSLLCQTSCVILLPLVFSFTSYSISNFMTSTPSTLAFSLCCLFCTSHLCQPLCLTVLALVTMPFTIFFHFKLLV